ncbi:hypothetical protein BG004_003884 [Podila humilis]|nr:hypothetical protein BG004_003884 [Podila humilis]
MVAQSPLDVPEILAIIGHFVPLWERGGTISYFWHFKPQHLLSCTSVCKSWRLAMWPILWHIYDRHQMDHLPRVVLSKNSNYFRFLDLNTPPFRRQEQCGLDGDDLVCTRINSCSLTIPSLERNIVRRLLQVNPGLSTLRLDLIPPERLAELNDDVSPVSDSVQDLSISMTEVAPQPVLTLLSRFANIERFTLEQLPNYHVKVPTPFTDIGPHSPVTTRSVKDLRIRLATGGDVLDTNLLESILRGCPEIKKLRIRLCSSGSFSTPASAMKYLDHVESVQKIVAASYSPLNSTSQMSGSGLEYLQIHTITIGARSCPFLVHEFEPSTRQLPVDLVGLTAHVWYKHEFDYIFPYLQSLEATLQRLDIALTAVQGRSMEVLSDILGRLANLRSLKFVTNDGLTKAETISIFNDHFGESTSIDASADGSVSSCTWACQNLESLLIHGIFRTGSKDKLGKDQSVLILKASGDHQWVADGPTKFGKRLLGLVERRLQTLPELRRLSLSGVGFTYSKT